MKYKFTSGDIHTEYWYIAVDVREKEEAYLNDTGWLTCKQAGGRASERASDRTGGRLSECENRENRKSNSQPTEREREQGVWECEMCKQLVYTYRIQHTHLAHFIGQEQNGIRMMMMMMTMCVWVWNIRRKSQTKLQITCCSTQHGMLRCAVLHRVCMSVNIYRCILPLNLI